MFKLDKHPNDGDERSADEGGSFIMLMRKSAAKCNAAQAEQTKQLNMEYK